MRFLHRRFGPVISLFVLIQFASVGDVVAATAEVIASGLNQPTAFTLAPDGRIFYAERGSGQIRILNPEDSSNALFFTVTNLVGGGEGGLLGLALDPGYPRKRFVYAYASRDPQGTRRNQILRIRDRNARGRNPRVIFSSETEAEAFHLGGRILFGPDRKLYAVVGDATDPGNAQDLAVTAGKILRMSTRGRSVPGNPFGSSLVWSYGHRNSFGFTFDPATGALWQTENGPACNDEINRVIAGGNYAWGPNATCPLNTNQDGPVRMEPVAMFNPTIAPTGAVFCNDCGVPEAEGQLLFGAYDTGAIQRATLTGNRLGIASIALLYQHSSAVLSMERGPDGSVYFSDFSAIYRLVP